MAVFVDDFFGKALQRGLVGKIAGEIRVVDEVDDAYLRACAGECVCDALADAARTAGDDRDLVFGVPDGIHGITSVD